MIRGRNILCIASNWFDHPTSKHHVMRLLSEQNHVLWINFHASRRPRLTRGDVRLGLQRLRQACCRVRHVAPQMDVLSPLLIPLPAAPLVRAINAQVLERQIRSALRRLPQRPTQLWLFAPDIPEVIGRLPAERVVYYCVDDFAAFSGYDTAGVEQLERQTLAGSDVVITTSAALWEQRRQTHRSVHLVTHGVDFEHFAAATDLPRAAIPEDLQRLAAPVFGYMGTVSDYVDLDLLAAAARARPAWSFVLLGDVRCSLAPLGGAANVYVLGGRPYTELPRYCRGFDVGLIPFRMNRLTRAVNPIKLREYLAAGLPVVSSPLDTVRPYAPAVQTADTLATFLAACQVTLAMAADGRPRARQDLVRAESWRCRVELVSELVQSCPASSAPVDCTGGTRAETGRADLSSRGAAFLPLDERCADLPREPEACSAGSAQRISISRP